MAIVSDLTSETFDSFLKQNERVLVALTLPFLPRTQTFLTEFRATAAVLSSSGVRCANIDCQKEDGFGPVNRWPDVKLYRGLENSTRYEGAWKAPDLVAWTKRQMRPKIAEVNAEQLSLLREDHSAVVLGSFDSSDEGSRQTFTTIVEEFKYDYVFVLDSDLSIAQQERMDVPNIVIFKSYDEPKTTIQLPMEHEELKSRIKTSCESLIRDIRPETHNQLVDTGLPIAYTLTDGSADQETFARTILTAVAKQNVGKMIFGIADVHFCGFVADEVHLDKDRLPAFAIRDFQKGRFPLSQDQQLSTDIITTFVARFINGEVEPTIKSESVPEKQDDPVTIVVGDTYNSIVINNNKDVLLDYYTQWCGPCKAMYPKYEELARLYASNPTASHRVTIAKVDAEANDVPGDIRGFPTFKLFPAQAKESPIDYAGPWTVEGFASFIRDNGTHKIDMLRK